MKLPADKRNRLLARLARTVREWHEDEYEEFQPNMVRYNMIDYGALRVETVLLSNGITVNERFTIRITDDER